MKSKKLYAVTFLSLLLLNYADAQILVSGYLANPAGTDNNIEYVQLIATQDINFATTSYSVVWANNGTANANGWVTGGATTYGFNLTTGSVSRGDVFYVGGSAKVINGTGSTDISGLTWIRSINTGTTAGDGFGSLNSSGVFGNGGTSADGIGIFSGTTSLLTSTSTPIDAIFYGTAVGGANPATGGYTLPTNDRYSSSAGTFGDGSNIYLFPDGSSAAFVTLTGTFDYNNNSWISARTGSTIALTTTSTSGDIATTLSLIPEPSSSMLMVLGAGGLIGIRAFGRKQS